MTRTGQKQAAIAAGGRPLRVAVDSPSEREVLINRDELAQLFARTRRRTEELAAPLSPEDQQLQSMPAASPTKWHRAHTTWFFETFVLLPLGIAPCDERFGFLFNSYYEAVGPRHERSKRGLLSRPSVGEVAAYRAEVDQRVIEVLGSTNEGALARLAPILRLGIAHEEQHQELLLTDILNALSENPLQPAYRVVPPANAAPLDRGAEPIRFLPFDAGLYTIGAGAETVFAFDNELPLHRRWLEPFSLADRLATVREMKEFIREGGYQNPSLWLSEGWDFVASQGIRAPLYARVEGGAYLVFGLDGVRVARDDEPVLHVSFYEADALARYLGARLPTEAEWEVAASRVPVEGNFLDSGSLRPLAAARGSARLQQLFGDAWEWTRSSYEPYPGYAPGPGALGEYNGKFMVNQIVLRGGSCFTPSGHVRLSYRNFWPAATRFQAAGVRLSKDV
jgi:ergothioneine biosynthesis protein EgtB